MVIAGGGPTGLMLAGELALAGVDVVVVERRASQDLDGPGRHRPAYLVSLDDAHDVERWPAAKQPVRCA